MPHAELTRIVRFAAAHRYYRPEWSDAENARVFGDCANPHGHGHNYILEVTVSAAIDSTTGFSANLPALDELLQSNIVRVFDHKHINHAIPEFGEGKLIPTSENIARYCWDRIRSALDTSMTLVRVRVREDETFFVDYTGDD